MDQGQTTRPPVAQSQTIQDPASRPEITAGRAGGSRQSSDATGYETRPTSSTQNLISPSGARTTFPRSHDNPSDFERAAPLPPPPVRSRDGHVRISSRPYTIPSNVGPPVHASDIDIDHLVPLVEKSPHPHHVRQTIQQRIDPTIKHARDERSKYARQGLWYKYAINIAIILQVTLGALTTGIAASIRTARQAQVSTAILGGLSTLVAAYLARVRGSEEPEFSTARVKDLDQFLRECEAFKLDHGHECGIPKDDLDREVERLRERFEVLLGNPDGYVIASVDGQKKRSSDTGDKSAA